MTTKPTSSFFIVLFAALLLPLGAVGLATAAPSAVQPMTASPTGTETGNLYEDPSSIAEGQTIKVTANFPSDSASELATLYRETSPGSWTAVDTDQTNRYGNAYFLDYQVNGNQKIYAQLPNGNRTEVDTLTPEQAAPTGPDTGNLYQDPSSIAEGQTIKVTANFPSDSASELAILYRETSPGSWTAVDTDETNRYGNAYFLDYQVEEAQKIYAQLPNGNRTEVDTLTPVPSSALLDPNFTPAGSVGQDARAKATFEPAQPGSSAELQIKSIKDGSWDTIDTGTQDANGVATFYISDPLEVEHEYRARSNGIATTNQVTWAGPLLDKDTGLATVHFASDDGDSVNTRTKWFDGELTIKGGAGCSSQATYDQAEMRGRGNYSWSFPKKGFNLKLDDKLDLCDMGNSKKWALVANDYDRSLLRNSAANFVGAQFTNLEFTPKDMPVDLYVNGSYRGSYILIERVNLEGGRLDVDELKAEDTPELCSGPDPSVNTTSPVNGTYLMEWDFRKGANFNFGAGAGHGWVGLKEPEDEDYCQNMGAFINDYVDIADRDLYDGKPHYNDWMKWIDLDSAVDYYIAMEFLKPVDGQMWASVYMYKPRGEKIHFGPLWDFDLAMGSATRAGNVVSPRGWYLRNPLNVSAKQTEVTWFNKLNENPTFRAAVKKRWNEVDQDINDVIAYLRSRENLIDQSAAENYRKWDHGKKISKYQVVKGSWGSDVDYLVDWLDKRWRWMNGQLDNAAG